jgi:phytoene synthase
VVCVRVWGSPGGRPVDAAAIPLAIDRGIAFQLTNILRDLREDAAIGRSYLPLAEYHRAGLTPGDLLAWRDPPACRAFLAAQVERARELYRSSAALDALIDPPCRPTLAAMTGIYRELLERIASDPRRVILGRRVSLPAWRKLAIAFRARRA